jgi:hypothetical protein
MVALQDQCRAILIDSEFLRETCIFSARVCAAGIGAQVYGYLRSSRPLSAIPGFTELSTGYRNAISSISTQANNVFPNSSTVSKRIAQFVPFDKCTTMTRARQSSIMSGFPKTLRNLL